MGRVPMAFCSCLLHYMVVSERRADARHAVCDSVVGYSVGVEGVEEYDYVSARTDAHDRRRVPAKARGEPRAMTLTPEERAALERLRQVCETPIYSTVQIYGCELSSKQRAAAFNRDIQQAVNIALRGDDSQSVIKEGEKYWLNNTTQLAYADFQYGYQLVLVPKFNLKEWWPKWLTAPWIAMSDSERWFAFGTEPSSQDTGWYGCPKWCGCPKLSLSSSPLLDFTPPLGFTKDNWRDSKLKNPNL